MYTLKIAVCMYCIQKVYLLSWKQGKLLLWNQVKIGKICQDFWHMEDPMRFHIRKYVE